MFKISEHLKIIATFPPPFEPVSLVFDSQLEAVEGRADAVGVDQFLHPDLELLEGGDVEADRDPVGQLGELDPLGVAAEESAEGFLFLDVVRVEDDP